MLASIACLSPTLIDAAGGAGFSWATAKVHHATSKSPISIPTDFTQHLPRYETPAPEFLIALIRASIGRQQNAVVFIHRRRIDLPVGVDVDVVRADAAEGVVRPGDVTVAVQHVLPVTLVIGAVCFLHRRPGG